MILGIDASNIRGGGGVTHLVELLDHASPYDFGFDKVIVWSGSNTLDKIKPKPWLEKIQPAFLNKSLLHRTYWQRFQLSKEALEHKCDLLFIPGGSFSGSFRPFVTMNQNLLPFEWEEINRYKVSLFWIKLILLRFTQSNTFKKANGIIFLTSFAKKRVYEQFPIERIPSAIVSHGINPKFFMIPMEQKDLSEYSESNPLKILYVSFIGEYKHQWSVINAIGILRENKIPVQLILIGSPDEKKALLKMNQAIQKVDPKNHFIQYYSRVSYTEIENKYREADIFLFASSCESFGQIVTEAMATGLPIACSRLSAMPELLQDSAEYFHPEKPEEIAQAVDKLIQNKDLRERLSKEVHEKAKTYSWDRCANETFQFLQSVVSKNSSIV